MAKDKANRVVIYLEQYQEDLLRLVANEYCGSERNMSQVIKGIINHYVESGMPYFTSLPKSKFDEKVKEVFTQLIPTEPEPIVEQPPAPKVYASVEEEEYDKRFQYWMEWNVGIVDYNKPRSTRQDMRFIKMYNCFFDNLVRDFGQKKKPRLHDVDTKFLWEQFVKGNQRCAYENIYNHIHQYCWTTPATIGFYKDIPALVSGREFDVWRMFIRDGGDANYWVYFRFNWFENTNAEGEKYKVVSFIPTDPNGFDKEDYEYFGLQQFMPFYFSYSDEKLAGYYNELEMGRSQHPGKNIFNYDDIQPVVISGKFDPELKPYKYWETDITDNIV